MTYLHHGDESPSFAQTGAEFNLDDSDVFDEDDDDHHRNDGYHGTDDYDLRFEAGSGSSEAYEMVSGSARDVSRGRGISGGGGGDGLGSKSMGAQKHLDGAVGRGASSGSSAASFQLYTPDEEIAVRRKFDRKLVLFVALLFMLSFVDRSNIGNARIAGMEEDLQTDPPRDDWYDWSLTAFYLSYIAFEWMSLLWKLIPAHVFVSLTVLSWGVIASLQAVAPSYPVLVALRVLLGVGEAAFAGIPFYLSFFFKRRELAFRTAIFISAAPLATSFASTLAWLIVRLARFGPIAPWRLLFLLEGFPSVVISVVAWNVIPDSPQTASYLTKRERKVARLRLRGEKAASSSSSSSSSGLKSREILAVLRDPVAWITAAMLFLTNMAYSSLPVFLPKIMTEMGHDVLASQALSAPPYLIAFVVVLFTAHMSDRLGVRTVPIVFHAFSSALGYAVLALAESFHIPPFLRYLAVYPAAIGFFNVVTLVIAWSINNQASESRQGGGFALMQLIGQCGPMVGTRLYPNKDAPYYSHGMQTCAWAMFVVAILALVLRIYLRHRNRKMDEAEAAKLASGTTVEEEGLVAFGILKRTPRDTFRYML